MDHKRFPAGKKVAVNNCTNSPISSVGGGVCDIRSGRLDVFRRFKSVFTTLMDDIRPQAGK